MIRAVEGPIASVRGERPDEVAYEGAAAALRDVWIAVRTAMRGVLERRRSPISSAVAERGDAA